MTPTILGGPEGPLLPPLMATAPASTSLVSLDDIRDAVKRIAGVARRTPLLDVGGAYGEPAFAVKCENMQPAGAFKIRGAYNMMAQLSPDARAAGVITYSSGNHGQAMVCLLYTSPSPRDS